MTLRNLLEEFHSHAGQRSDAEATDSTAIETARTEGFEQGYKSGWEDAIADERRRRGHVNAEFERCIQELGLNYHEAVDLVRSEMSTFLNEFVETVLPAVATDLMRETICGVAMELAEGQLNPSIKLLASGTVAEQLQDMMPEAAFEITVEVEPSLSPYQAYLSVSGRERAIDFEPLIEALREQLSAVGRANTQGIDNE